MAGRHHRLNGHEPEQALGDGEGQGSLMCYIPWGHKESDMTERPNNSKGNGGRTKSKPPGLWSLSSIFYHPQ